MKISADQMLKGVITEIREGPVNADVFIRLPNGEIMAAVVTRSSIKNLGLSIGMPLFRKTSLTTYNHTTVNNASMAMSIE